MPQAWSREEVEATVADYFRMFELELAGQKYNKTEHRNRLLALLNDRTPSAVELKRQNISAVLDELGWHFIPGYKPARNYQKLLFDVVSERISHSPQLDQKEAAAVQMPAALPSVSDFKGSMVDAPRVLKAAESAANRPRIAFSASKRDYVAQEGRNSSLGKAGEEFVVLFEQWRLAQSGKKGLAEMVEHVSQTKGDGLGFDVLSFEQNGEERFIEVKTTAFGKETPFFLSQTELERSQTDAPQYLLYRVFEFRAAPKMFALKGAVDRSCILDPLTYRARFG
jgi:hypothetical protein